MRERCTDDATLALLADMCRANALVAVKRAGSGHLGSSFSALDVVAHLLFRELNVAELGWDHPDRDVFFSSRITTYRASTRCSTRSACSRTRACSGCAGSTASTVTRTSSVPGIEANSGSLGMGISKGRGIAGRSACSAAAAARS